VWSRDELLSALGADGGFDATDRAIDSHVKNLRRKLGDNPRSPRYIETVYGLGYRCPMGTTGTAGPVTPRG